MAAALPERDDGFQAPQVATDHCSRSATRVACSFGGRPERVFRIRRDGHKLSPLLDPECDVKLSNIIAPQVAPLRLKMIREDEIALDEGPVSENAEWTMSVICRRSFLLLIAGIAVTMPARSDAVDAQMPPSGRRIALSGYDPVSYFTPGQPEKGNQAFWFAYDDAVYYFKSSEHRAKFAADPERYAPQYDGFCAAGLSKGVKHEPDPEAWAIVNGKLYVVEFKERIAEFKKHPERFIGKADANWLRLRTAPVSK